MALNGLLSDDLHRCRESLHSEVTDEHFKQCVESALEDELRNVPNRSQPAKARGCKCCFPLLKVVWVCWLGFCGFCLVAVKIKPVAFHLHKAVHDKLYYILRPIRLALVTLLPYLNQMGLDFLNTDCMLENPFLSGVEGCACFRIKYPQELVLNSSVLPPSVTQSGLLDVYVLRNVSQYPGNFSLEDFTSFPSLNGGMYPVSCHEISGVDSKMYRYDEFYHPQKMTKFLRDKNPWAFSWEECPDSSNPLTLHSVIPPLDPLLELTPNSTFNLATKWGTFTHFEECFLSGAVVIARVLLGEVRFVMEPKQEQCFGMCSVFRKNPVLKQGDALLFDQRVWSYMATSWTNITFVTVQLVSFV